MQQIRRNPLPYDTGGDGGNARSSIGLTVGTSEKLEHHLQSLASPDKCDAACTFTAARQSKTVSSSVIANVLDSGTIPMNYPDKE